jgi:hypothetical protein
MNVNNQEYEVKYLPGESDSGMFGGNSNWRGPIWFPVNFLLVEALQRFYLYYGPELKVECPKGSGTFLNLAQCAQEIQYRLMHLFVPDENGDRACNGGNELLNRDPLFKDYVPFYEYFDGDTGRGLGASHQCGWTAVVAKWIHDNGMTCRVPKTPNTPGTPSSRRSSVYVPEDTSTTDSFKQFYPKSGPFPGTLSRRKSGKSLLNLTAHGLDLDEEELENQVKIVAAKKFDDGSQGVEINQEVELKLNTNELEELVPAKSVSDENLAIDQDLLEQVKVAFRRYSMMDDNDVQDYEEFETRN